ncbi:MAG TPA: hypothetical protein VH040_08780 [Usitatibacter sp.]|jgi:hypothetical protein|nr:hypothetical protein [Usitatibacter sp.]
MIRSVAAASLCALAASLAPSPAAAVRLAEDGLGQALIYPYYTARSSDGNAWNTLLSVVNTREKPKVVKVRFREAVHGRIVWEANVYLGPYDMWTAAVIPGSDGAAHLVSADKSCIDPPHSGSDAGAFSTASFSGGAADGARTGLGTSGVDRTLEGFAEVIEMGTLAGETAAAVTMPTPEQSPVFDAFNCAHVVGTGFTRNVEAPEGGLSGTALLLNVNSGLSLPYEPVALADLTRSAFYSDVGASGTDYDSPQVTPESVVVLPASIVAGFGSGYLLRSSWNRGVDAVSAVLMTSAIQGEYVLDAVTQSETEWVVTLPTARFYTDAAPPVPPFTHSFSAAGACELHQAAIFDREQARGAAGIDLGAPGPPASSICYASTVLSFRNGTIYSPSTPALPTLLLGSDTGNNVEVESSFQDGFVLTDLSPSSPGLTSLASSTTIDLGTGNVSTGAQTFKGLPVIGFAGSSFNNGLLDCSGQRCSGNFGVAYPLHAIRDVSHP